MLQAWLRHWSNCGTCEAANFVTHFTELIPGFFAQK
jgi:hypothetical protein